ncbi:MAG: ATP-binding cassette domain-containing protein [candidate division KSB1 bacterium]|nr:ATP-binding cassette domain-containing protein [candidate division KSB1 bacterium]
MITITNLVFEYNTDSFRALDGINLAIREGEAITLMGPNSSGKTTLARCLNGLLLPTRGEVKVDGLSTQDTAHLVEIRKKVGMVFQNPDNQIVSTTVEREIAFGLENLGLPTPAIHQKVDEMLERFNLTPYRKHPPHLLSGGQKQRLALAAVLAMNPSYLVLDEPTSLLDPQGRKEVLSLLQQIHLENQTKAPQDRITTLLITQFPEEALTSQRLIVMEKGRIIFDDQPEVVFRHVDRLQEIGLDVPVHFELENWLKETGIPISEILND